MASIKFYHHLNQRIKTPSATLGFRGAKNTAVDPKAIGSIPTLHPCKVGVEFGVLRLRGSKSLTSVLVILSRALENFSRKVIVGKSQNNSFCFVLKQS